MTATRMATIALMLPCLPQLLWMAEGRGRDTWGRMSVLCALIANAEANNGKQPSAKLVEQIKQGIQIKHWDLEGWYALPLDEDQ